MTTELKRRLRLSKWRCELESLRENAEQYKKDVADRDEKIDELEATVKEIEDDLEAAREAHVGETADLECALSDVRYWLLDGLAHHKLVSNPRALLRKIEDVL